MDFTDEINCRTCKHGYFNEISLDGQHNLCGAYRCYLCAENSGYCDRYKNGTPPDEKEKKYKRTDGNRIIGIDESILCRKCIIKLSFNAERSGWGNDS